MLLLLLILALSYRQVAEQKKALHRAAMQQRLAGKQQLAARQAEQAAHDAEAAAEAAGEQVRANALQAAMAAASLFEKQEYGASALAFEHAIALSHPRAGSCHNAAGLCLHAEAKYKEALLHCTAAVEAEPTEVSYLVNRAVVLSALERLSEAEADLRKALKVNPAYAEARARLEAVVSRSKTQRLELAFRQKASCCCATLGGLCCSCRGSTTVSTTESALQGSRLFGEEKYAEAMAAFECAIASGHGKPASCHNAAGLCASNLGQHEAAVRHFDAAVTSTTEASHPCVMAKYLVSRGASQHAVGRLAEAEADLRKAAALDEGSTDAKVQLAAVLAAAAEKLERAEARRAADKKAKKERKKAAKALRRQKEAKRAREKELQEQLETAFAMPEAVVVGSSEEQAAIEAELEVEEAEATMTLQEVHDAFGSEEELESTTGFVMLGDEGSVAQLEHALTGGSSKAEAKAAEKKLLALKEQIDGLLDTMTTMTLA